MLETGHFIQELLALRQWYCEIINTTLQEKWIIYIMWTLAKCLLRELLI